jgi:putative DNA primase/helicase
VATCEDRHDPYAYERDPVSDAARALAARISHADRALGIGLDQATTLSLVELTRLAGVPHGDALRAVRAGVLEGRGLAVNEIPWPVPRPLPDGPAVPGLDSELVPVPLRPWIGDIAGGACLAPEMVAIPALVGASSLIGRNGQIQPDPASAWLATPNLWGAVVARPGTMKSGALSAAGGPIGRLVAAAREEHEDKRRRSEARSIALNGRLKALSRQKGANETEIEELLREIESCKVTERRYRTNDSTTEKIGELLRENPRGMLLVRDELAGWLRALDKPGREGDREFWLEAWDGSGSYTYDRIGRGTIHVPSLCMSVVGCFQPGKLTAYRDAALGGGAGDDGLLQRFQLLVWPDTTPDWTRDGRRPRKAHADRVAEIWRRIDEIYREPRSAACLAVTAQELHDQWRDALEARLRSPALAATPAFESHMSKYRGLLPSLAMVLHTIDCADLGDGGVLDPGLIPRVAVERAIRWCEYLEAHARKVYAPELDPGHRPAATIAAKIRARAVIDGQPVRDLYRTGWAGVRSQSAAEEGLAVLERLGWVRLQSVSSAGRSSAVIRINPGLELP